MKTLLLLRHAKSSWKEPALDDHDRPLAKRGKRAAPRIGKLLAERELVPDLILTSTATRALDTAQLVMRHAGYSGDVIALRALYLAEPDEYRSEIRAYGAGATTLLVVGHNPGLEDLVAEMSEKEERLPTGALAHFKLGIDSWRELFGEATARLVGVHKPRELDDD